MRGFQCGLLLMFLISITMLATAVESSAIGESCMLEKYANEYSLHDRVAPSATVKARYRSLFQKRYKRQYGSPDWQCSERFYSVTDQSGTTTYRLIVRWNQTTLPVHATVLWVTGDDGRATWSEFDPIYNLRKRLSLNHNIRSIEIQFINPPPDKGIGEIFGGYLTKPRNSFKKPAKAYTRLLHNLVENDKLARGKWLAHVGHSNGANLIAFAMTFHNADRYIDKALFMNGPFLTDIGRQCEDPNYPGYLGATLDIKREKTLRYLIDKMAGLETTDVKIELPLKTNSITVFKRIVYPCLLGNVYAIHNTSELFGQLQQTIKTMAVMLAGKREVAINQVNLPKRKSFYNSPVFDELYAGLSLFSNNSKHIFKDTDIITIQGKDDHYKNWIVASNLDWYQRIEARTKQRKVYSKLGHRLFYTAILKDEQGAFEQLTQEDPDLKSAYDIAAEDIYQILKSPPSICCREDSR